MSFTIYDISKEAGVSIATVSRVINGNEKVKESTRKKVLSVMERLNYAPNAYARGMGLGSLKTIGILCADSSDLFLAKAVYSLEQQLQENGYESLLCCTGYSLEMKQSYLQLILSKKIDALILVGSTFIGSTEEENQYIKDASRQLPVMLLNASYDYPNVYSVMCDDEEAMTSAVDQLLKHTSKHILYYYDMPSYSGQKKLAGFQQAVKHCTSSSLTHSILRYQGPMGNIPQIAQVLQEYYEDGHSFDTIVCSDDTLAMGAMQFAHKNKLSIPDELSIMGYNNSMLTQCCYPALTSIDNRITDQTSQLIQTLLAVLSGSEMPNQCVFSGNLIVRDSTRV